MYLETLMREYDLTYTTRMYKFMNEAKISRLCYDSFQINFVGKDDGMSSRSTWKLRALTPFHLHRRDLATTLHLVHQGRKT